MTDIHFDRPPLVELIVELRWLLPGVKTSPADPSQIEVPFGLFVSGQADALFMNFAGLIGQDGFLHSERMYPAGMPTPPYQPVYRYSKQGAKAGEPLYQLGNGIFSVHITPPYKRWKEFRPFVECGLDKLLRARPTEEKKTEFSSAMVRYLDCFTHEYLGERSSSRFLSEVLGIKLTLPSAITTRLATDKEVTHQMQILVPNADDRTMSINIAHGRIGQYQGLIMDSNVSTTKPLNTNSDDVMRFLEEAHRAVSDMFVELTRPIHDVMVLK